MVGVVSGLWTIDYFEHASGEDAPFAVGANYWSGDPAIGSIDSDPYTRARIARTGLLALSRKEAIYFFRNRDNDGQRLREGCEYRMTGGALPARWWSVTLYAADDYLAVNNDGAHSVSSEQDGTEGDSWNVEIGSGELPDVIREPLGISDRNAGDYSLTLRLYNPAPGAVAEPSKIPFPNIERLSCKGQAS